MSVLSINRSIHLLRAMTTCVLCFVMPWACGCGSRAHSDLYQQRMASEIRVLEDQLYDADYQNRVLQEKLQRYQQKVESSRIPTPIIGDSGVLKPNGSLPRSHSPNHELGNKTGIPVPLADPNTSYPVESIIPEQNLGGPAMVDPLDIPSFDMGEPFDPSTAADISNGPSILESSESDAQVLPPPVKSGSDSLDRNPTPKKSDVPKPLADPAEPADQPNRPSGNQEPPAGKPAASVELLPPPSTPIPPGRQQVRPDLILPGDPSPPAREGDREAPPGQINLPESFGASLQTPNGIRLHKTLSKGHHNGAQLAGATLIVNAIDTFGKRVDLNRFDIDAELSVVVLDPSRSSAEARLGRWDFDVDQVAAMVSSDNGRGLEIPIRFEDTKPTTDQIIVHVRLRGEEDEMRCNDQLDLRKSVAETPWTPRAGEH